MSFFFEQALVARAREFIALQLLQGSTEGNRAVVIAYHGDGDGCSSAYFVQKHLKTPALFYWVATPDFDFEKAEDHILEHHPTLVVFLDMPVYNRPSMFAKLTDQGTKVLVYDHHYPGKCFLCEENASILYVNPVLDHDARAYPACLFGWELLEEKNPFENELLYMGLYTETWLQQVSLFQDFPPDLRRSLKEVAKRIQASFLVQDTGTTHHALDFLLKAAQTNTPLHADPQALREHQVLANIYDLIQHEKSWLMKELQAEIRGLDRPKFIIKRAESRIRLCGLIASELRWKYSNLVIGIWQKWEERFICELRRGTGCRVNLAALIEAIKAEIPLLTGGGHPEAAAFTGEQNDFFQALEIIKALLVRDQPED